MIPVLSNVLAQVYSSIVITLILCVICIFVGLKVKKVDPTKETPKWLVPFIILVDLINNMTKENLGKRWKSYAPYFLSLTIFLFIANTCSIFGLANPTSYLIINAALAFVSFIIIQLTGIVSNGIKGYLKSFIEPIFFLLPINIISEFTLPISLALRLMGNVMSGAVIEKLVIGLAGFGAVPFMPILNGVFDLFSGTIQVLVFLLLTMMFAGMKLNDRDQLTEESSLVEENK